MQIEVGHEHIEWGDVDDCLFCPVSLALLEAGVLHIEVHQNSLWDAYAKRWIVMPAQVRRFVRAFDGGRQVKPFSFDLDVPCEA